MLIDEYHPEDIKAAIRKRFKSMLEFERRNGLARQSVTDLLRGRATSDTERAVRTLLEERENESIIPARISRAA